MALSRDRVLELQRRGLRDWISTLARSSDGARMFERNGVSAAIVPASAQRSIPNSVSYTDSRALLGSLDELAELYRGAGIDAWTVWVPDFDAETIAALEQAGHRFDGRPAAMALELDAFEPPGLGDLDWEAEVSGEDFGRINDRAYGIGERGYAPSLVDPPSDLRRYVARVDGEPACVLATMDHPNQEPQHPAPQRRRTSASPSGLRDRRRRGSATPPSDLGFYFVATDPRFQRRGLAGRLMAVPLAEARERGLRTSSLQASAMGEPVYRRLGYEVGFRLHLYERRTG